MKNNPQKPKKLPSERIKEIAKSLYENDEVSIERAKIEAIIIFLDEKYEQEKPCEHEYEPFKDYAQTCKKCGIISNF